MFVAVVVDSIQGKSRFTVGEGELRNSTMAEGRVLVSNKKSVKKVGGILAGLKILRGWCPCLPKYIIHIKSYLYFCHTKLKSCIFTYSSSFLLMSQHISNCMKCWCQYSKYCLRSLVINRVSALIPQNPD